MIRWGLMIGFVLVAQLAWAAPCTLPLAPGETCTESATIQVPLGTPPGSYQVCFTATDSTSHPSQPSLPMCATVTVVTSDPESNDVTMPFTLTTSGQRFAIDIPPYRCARWTGGTSVVRITTVAANGAETVLKQVGTPNPASNVTFSMRCQISSTLSSLSINGQVLASAVVTGPPEPPSLPPPPPPDGGDISQTFSLTTSGQKFAIDVPPYRCARWTGGTSVVRITRVSSAGAETVLKSTATQNPIKDVPFTMRCEVTATQLVLSIGGKVLATSPP